MPGPPSSGDRKNSCGPCALLRSSQDGPDELMIVERPLSRLVTCTIAEPVTRMRPSEKNVSVSPSLSGVTWIGNSQYSPAGNVSTSEGTGSRTGGVAAADAGHAAAAASSETSAILTRMTVSFRSRTTDRSNTRIGYLAPSTGRTARMPPTRGRQTPRVGEARAKPRAPSIVARGRDQGAGATLGVIGAVVDDWSVAREANETDGCGDRTHERRW